MYVVCICRSYGLECNLGLIAWAISIVGLRELCSKFLSLFYSEFPLKSLHYAHFYSQISFIMLTFILLFYAPSIILPVI